MDKEIPEIKEKVVAVARSLRSKCDKKAKDKLAFDEKIIAERRDGILSYDRYDKPVPHWEEENLTPEQEAKKEKLDRKEELKRI